MADDKPPRPTLQEAMRLRLEPIPGSPLPTPPSELGNGSPSGEPPSERSRFSLSEMFVFILCECTGIPLCIAGGDAIAHSQWGPATVGWGFGIPLSVTGFTFPFWKGSMKALVRRWTHQYGGVALPVVIVMAFIYVIAPDIYRRTIILPTSVAPNPVGFTQEQVDKKIQEAVNQIQNQLDAARRDLDAANQKLTQTNAPAVQPPSSATSETAPRTYTNKTIAELMGFYEGRTALQGDVFMADEEGRWIATEGVVKEIQPEAVVVLRVGNYSVTCIFDAKWKPKLSAFRNGETMRIVGKIIPGQNGGSIYLRPCELRD